MPQRGFLALRKVFLKVQVYVSLSVEHVNYLFREVHEGSLANHYGENMTLAMLREHYYWPGMTKDI